jgi:hypothetical protein
MFSLEYGLFTASLFSTWSISYQFQATGKVHSTSFFFFVVLGLELRAFTLNHSTSPTFCKGFFEIGSHELFAQVGFELQAS